MTLEKFNTKRYVQLVYDMYGAYLNGVNKHPQAQMKNLGYHVLGSVPQSICDCWWFTVETLIEPLPPYLSVKEKPYNVEYWHGGCWKDCTFFKENPSCCVGGAKCLKG